MRKKNYKGAKVSKRVVAKCEGVCRTYDAIQYTMAIQAITLKACDRPGK